MKLTDEEKRKLIKKAHWHLDRVEAAMKAMFEAIKKCRKFDGV